MITIDSVREIARKCVARGFFDRDPSLWNEHAKELLGERALLDTPWRHHGLGLLQRELTETERVHVWSPALRTLSGPRTCHDHRFDLHSVVLFGTLFDTRISVQPTLSPSPAAVPMYAIAHAKIQTPSEPHATFLGYVETRASKNVALKAPDSYFIPRGLFHQSVPGSSLVVTFVTRSNFSDEPARVLASPESGIVPKTSPDLIDRILSAAREKLAETLFQTGGKP